MEDFARIVSLFYRGKFESNDSTTRLRKNRDGRKARARASSLFTSIDRGGWCGIADRLWRESRRKEYAARELAWVEGCEGVRERKSSSRSGGHRKE